MRFLYIAPSRIDDKPVHNVANDRINITKDVIQDAPAYDDIEVRANRYRQYLVGAQNEMGKITETACIFTGMGVILGENVGEHQFMDGSYASHRYLQDRVLSALRNQIKREIVGEGTIVHVDIGMSMTSLYAAYFASLEANCTSLTVSLHTPSEGNIFALGGVSNYGKQFPLLRRKLGSTFLKKAAFVFVPCEEFAGALHRLFPFINRPYSLDPLIGETPAPEQPELFAGEQA